ncbi:MAG: prepilin-type N-terminal cleavage/methylation domain-containing protein [bacterium]|nr:prepilin-type N-terminal cleavage/methylation domain-containing protein [bacterium]
MIFFLLKKRLRRNGFSLVELMLVVSISAMILGALAFFFGTLIQARVKGQVIADVEQQGDFIMRTILSSVRNAATLNTPTQGVSAAVLSINTDTPVLNPTVFDSASSTLRIKEGTASPVNLGSSGITASAVSFHNTSRAGTRGIIRVQFTLSTLNSTGRQEYDYQKTFYGSASLR